MRVHAQAPDLDRTPTQVPVLQLLKYPPAASHQRPSSAACLFSHSAPQCSLPSKFAAAAAPSSKQSQQHCNPHQAQRVLFGLQQLQRSCSARPFRPARTFGTLRTHSFATCTFALATAFSAQPFHRRLKQVSPAAQRCTIQPQPRKCALACNPSGNTFAGTT